MIHGEKQDAMPIISDKTGDMYSVAEVIDKTLVAAKDVPVYDYPGSSGKVIGTTKKGYPVGVVYAWIQETPQEGGKVWWMFWPASNYDNYFYAVHDKDAFDVDALRQQGVLNVQERKEAENDKNKEWYERLAEITLKAIVPVALVIGLGGPAIKGLLSRGKNNS